MTKAKTTIHSEPPLHKAVREDDMESFTKLLSESSNFGIQDSNGDNVVNVAVREGRLDMLKKLAKAADLNATNKNGEPPLEIAFRSGNAEMVRFLIAEGADINVKFKDGSTLLHNIVKNANELNLLDYALDNGAEIKMQDRRGNTALHYAVNLAYKNPELRQEFTQIALTLIERAEPAVFTQPNLLRNTCLAIALKTRNEDVLNAMAKKSGLTDVLGTAQSLGKTASNPSLDQPSQRTSSNKAHAR